MTQKKYSLLTLILTALTTLICGIAVTITIYTLILQKKSLERSDGQAVIYTTNLKPNPHYKQSKMDKRTSITPGDFSVSTDSGLFYPALQISPNYNSHNILGANSTKEPQLVVKGYEGSLTFCIGNVGGRIIQVKDIKFYIHFEPGARIYYFPRKLDYPAAPMGGGDPFFVDYDYYELNIELQGKDQTIVVLKKYDYPDIAPNQKLVCQANLKFEKPGIYKIVVQIHWKDVTSSAKHWQELKSDTVRLIFNDIIHWENLIEKAEKIKMIVKGWHPHETMRHWEDVVPDFEIIIEQTSDNTPIPTIEFPDLPWIRNVNYDSLYCYYSLGKYIDKKQITEFTRIGALPDSVFNLKIYPEEILIINDKIAMTNSTSYGASKVTNYKYVSKYLKFFSDQRAKKDNKIILNKQKCKMVIYFDYFYGD